MAGPIIIDIPHDLGRTEAKRRMMAGVDKVARHIPGGGEVSSSWPSEDRMTLTIAAMGQKISADLDVEDRLVKVRLAVPLMLSFMSGPITAIVQKSAEELLLNDAARTEG
jgi:hypothetical protein